MIKRFVKDNEVLKHVLTLLSGTVIAQILAIGMQPVLRRMFSVSDFGVMALYASAVGVLSIMATGRFEMAILLPKEDKNARAVFRISIFISLLFNLAVFVVLLFLANDIANMIVEHNLITDITPETLELIKYLIYCIPLGVFALSVYNAFNYLYTRSKDYKLLSVSRIGQSLTSNGVNAGMGLAGVGFFGLFFGYVLGHICSVLLLFLSKTKVLKGELGKTKENLKKYRDFPTKSVPSALLNMVALQLPNFFIFSFFGAQILGFFDIIVKVLSMPLIVIGKSISQVFYQKVTADINQGKEIGAYVKKFSLKLFLIMLLPMAVIFFFGGPLFGWAFGSDYEQSGELASYFSIFFLVRFIYYSQSTLFSAMRKLGVEFRQNLIFLCTQIAALLIGCYYFDDYVITFKLLALSGFICYTLFTFVLIKTAQGGSK
jgi:O-antigen/teichoic acid export membrane protein